MLAIAWVAVISLNQLLNFLPLHHLNYSYTYAISQILRSVPAILIFLTVYFLAKFIRQVSDLNKELLSKITLKLWFIIAIFGAVMILVELMGMLPIFGFFIISLIPVILVFISTVLEGIKSLKRHIVVIMGIILIPQLTFVIMLLLYVFRPLIQYSLPATVILLLLYFKIVYNSFFGTKTV